MNLSHQNSSDIFDVKDVLVAMPAEEERPPIAGVPRSCQK
ncbi:hypothetical protein NSU_0021 [Novosphingobium pentaromativorans US6-1]|uniref:Uncharacterized protein n=1 Tax=Novosphingobium pentaromativorans US6-1 TaxID=1088721 RepID=G6E6Q0_9SPHN|nr:hypothetical protein NSU_0021 [Novosphingobium pentaromativorans US6-1]